MQRSLGEKPGDAACLSLPPKQRQILILLTTGGMPDAFMVYRRDRLARDISTRDPAGTTGFAEFVRSVC